jgi:hypothetical protein
MKLIRRLHLYFGLTLLPWFLGYGISAAFFVHPEWGESIYGKPVWNVRFEKPYQLPDEPDLRKLGAILMKEAGVEGAYGTYKPSPERINVYAHSFRHATQVIYDGKKGTLRAEDKQFRWDHFSTGWHARGGFQQDSFLNDLWGVVVDLVSLAYVLWVVTGLLMWWQLRKLRMWGAIALGSGVGLFALLVALL